MSSVKQLQKMCGTMNKQGGADSGRWVVALLIQIAHLLAKIADKMTETEE